MERLNKPLCYKIGAYTLFLAGLARVLYVWC